MISAQMSVWAERFLMPVRAVFTGEVDAPPPDSREVAPRRRRRRAVGLLAGVTAVYFLVTWFYMGRAISSCTTEILGYPGDATAGLTWFTWADRSAGPVPGFRELTNAPFGESLGNPDQITAALPILAMWSLAHVTTPLCTWNLMVLFGYMSSALAMFGFMRWLTGNSWVGFVTGFMISYMPYHQQNALGHISYMLNFIFILFLWAFLRFWARPTVLRAVLMAVSVATCAYIDGYFILLGGVLAASVISAALIGEFTFFRDRAGPRKQRLKGLAVFAAAAGVLLLPIVWVQHVYGKEIAVALASSRDVISREATVYSARPYEYLMPAPGHPLLSKSYTELYERTLHGSNYTESVVYVGLTVLILASMAWIRLWRHRRRVHDRLRGLSLPFIVATMTATMLTAFLFSLPPSTSLFGHRVPLPSSLVIQVTAAWRVFARLYLVVETCLVVVAGVGIWFVIRGRAPKRQCVVAVVTVLLTFAEFLTAASGVVWSPSQAPDVYRWLRTQNDVHLIAEYPLADPPSQGILDYLTYQQIDGKSRFNTFRSDSPQRLLHRNMLGLADAQTVPILRALGVQLVLVHRRPADAVPGLRRLRQDRSHYNDDDVWTYRILPGREAPYAVLAAEGFHLPMLGDPLHSFIGAGTHGVLRLQPMPGGRKPARVRVTLTARAPGAAEPVQIAQKGIVRWKGIVARPTRITFVADTALPIDVMPRYPRPGDTIQISDMSAAP